jgi:periplasmic copper chaperone A
MPDNAARRPEQELIMKRASSMLAAAMAVLLAAGWSAPAGAASPGPVKDGAAAASVPTVEGAWVRSAVAGQQGTGAFMKLTARQATQLVAASTPVAGTAEVHEMKMDGEVMRMRRVARLDLPAGKTVELKPGGYHLMLLDLKQPLKTGSTVPLTLVFRDAGGAESRLELKVPVAMKGPDSKAHATTESHKH